MEVELRYSLDRVNDCIPIDVALVAFKLEDVRHFVFLDDDDGG